MLYWSALSGQKIPKLGFGTWQIQPRDAKQSVTNALSIGYRHIDTAQKYGNESEVGDAIKDSSVPREDIFLVTKIWRDYLSHDQVISSFEESLRKLKTDYVDLVLIHWPNSKFPLKPACLALRSLIEKKKIRHFGISNFTSSLMEEVREHKPLCNQVEYHPFLNQDILLKKSEELNMFLTAYSPLARGDVFKHPQLTEIGQKYGKNPGQVTLRWLIEQKNVVAIPKANQKEHAAANFNIFDFELSREDTQTINKLTQQNLRAVNPPWHEIGWD